MRVVALVEYEVLGDEEYTYVDSVDETYPKDTPYLVWRIRFIRKLLAREIICNKIKVISVEYEN